MTSVNLELAKATKGRKTMETVKEIWLSTGESLPSFRFYWLSHCSWETLNRRNACV
ncbi:hypothetical protein PO124_12210 [Bacillus licheniformis]|nr:hypothetical protein [Bacillus licheniformis]